MKNPAHLEIARRLKAKFPHLRDYDDVTVATNAIAEYPDAFSSYVVPPAEKATSYLDVNLVENPEQNELIDDDAKAFGNAKMYYDAKYGVDHDKYLLRARVDKEYGNISYQEANARNAISNNPGAFKKVPVGEVNSFGTNSSDRVTVELEMTGVTDEEVINKTADEILTEQLLGTWRPTKDMSAQIIDSLEEDRGDNALEWWFSLQEAVFKNLPDQAKQEAKGIEEIAKAANIVLTQNVAGDFNKDAKEAFVKINEEGKQLADAQNKYRAQYIPDIDVQDYITRLVNNDLSGDEMGELGRWLVGNLSFEAPRTFISLAIAIGTSGLKGLPMAGGRIFGRKKITKKLNSKARLTAKQLAEEREKSVRKISLGRRLGALYMGGSATGASASAFDNDENRPFQAIFQPILDGFVEALSEKMEIDILLNPFQKKQVTRGAWKFLSNIGKAGATGATSEILAELGQNINHALWKEGIPRLEELDEFAVRNQLGTGLVEAGILGFFMDANFAAGGQTLASTGRFAKARIEAAKNPTKQNINKLNDTLAEINKEVGEKVANKIVFGNINGKYIAVEYNSKGEAVKTVEVVDRGAKLNELQFYEKLDTLYKESGNKDMFLYEELDNGKVTLKAEVYDPQLLIDFTIPKKPTRLTDSAGAGSTAPLDAKKMRKAFPKGHKHNAYDAMKLMMDMLPNTQNGRQYKKMLPDYLERNKKVLQNISFNYSPGNWAGAYFHNNQAIHLNPAYNDFSTVLHESIHALTMPLLMTQLKDISMRDEEFSPLFRYSDNYGMGGRESFDLIKKLSEKYPETEIGQYCRLMVVAYEAMGLETFVRREGTNSLYQSVLGMPYGLSLIAEFATEALSDPDFQYSLASIKMPGESKSVLSKFVDWIARMLGFKSSENNLLFESLNLIQDINEEVNTKFIPGALRSYKRIDFTTDLRRRSEEDKRKLRDRKKRIFQRSELEQERIDLVKQGAEYIRDLIRNGEYKELYKEVFNKEEVKVVLTSKDAEFLAALYLRLKYQPNVKTGEDRTLDEETEITQPGRRVRTTKQNREGQFTTTEESIGESLEILQDDKRDTIKKVVSHQNGVEDATWSIKIVEVFEQTFTVLQRTFEKESGDFSKGDTLVTIMQGDLSIDEAITAYVDGINSDTRYSKASFLGNGKMPTKEKIREITISAFQDYFIDEEDKIRQRLKDGETQAEIDDGTYIFLDAPIPQFSERAQKVLDNSISPSRSTFFNKFIRDFVTGNFYKFKNVSTRIRDISAEIFIEERRMHQTESLLSRKYIETFKPFQLKYNKIRRQLSRKRDKGAEGFKYSELDEFNAAVLNGEWDIVINFGTRKGVPIREEIDSIIELYADAAKRLGFPPNRNYFRRDVVDVEALQGYLLNVPTSFLESLIARREKLLKRKLTPDERRSLIRSQITSGKSSDKLLQQRTVGKVDPYASRFYANPVGRQNDYFTRVARIFARSQFLGIKPKTEVIKADDSDLRLFDEEEVDGKKQKVFRKDKDGNYVYDDVIGEDGNPLLGLVDSQFVFQDYSDKDVTSLIDKIISNKGASPLNPGDKNELIKLIRSVVNYKPSGRFGSTYRTFVSIAKVAQPGTILLQLADVVVAMVYNGIPATVGAIFSREKMENQIGELAYLALEDIGIEAFDAELKENRQSASQDFKGVTSKALQKIVQVSFAPLGLMDRFGKRALAMSTVKRWKDLAVNDPQSLYRILKPKFIDDTFIQNVINDIANNKATPDALLAFYMEVSEYHPITTSDQIQWYIDHPALRPALVLTSFAFKIYDRFGRQATGLLTEGVSLIRAGTIDKNEDVINQGKQMVRDGFNGLFKFVIGTLGAELFVRQLIKKIYQDNGIEFEEEDDPEAWNNSITSQFILSILGLNPFISQFDIERLVESKKLGEVSLNLIRLVEPGGINTAQSIITSLFDEKKGLINWDDPLLYRDIPVIGQILFGQLKTEEKLREDSKKRSKPTKTKEKEREMTIGERFAL